MPSPMIESQMLECVVSGAKGLNTYSEGQFDALDMMYFVRAMKQITPLEKRLAHSMLERTFSGMSQAPGCPAMIGPTISRRSGLH